MREEKMREEKDSQLVFELAQEAVLAFLGLRGVATEEEIEPLVMMVERDFGRTPASVQQAISFLKDGNAFDVEWWDGRCRLALVGKNGERLRRAELDLP